MSVSQSVFTAWLKDSSAVRCVLVEVDVKLSGGSTVTRYLSNTGYVTASGDTPANTIYLPYIAGGVKFTESISLDGSFSMSYGDIELMNVNGELDTWLNDYWANRRVKVFIGDKSWVRDDFWQIFDGVATGVDSRRRETINLKLSDKLQRLNNPATEAKLGGATSNADQLVPLCIGECHNVEPLLADPTNHEYVVNDGTVEDFIEVRDNGVPISTTEFLATGRFRLTASPAGQITASVQGSVLAQNLVLRSQEFDNALWTKTASSITANGIPAPDGTNTADTLVENTSNSQHRLSQPVTVVAGSVYTMSVYVRANNRQHVRLVDGTGNSQATFNLSTASGSVSSTTNATAAVAALPNLWFRLIVTYTATTTSGGFQLWLLSADGSTSTYTGDGSSGVRVWGAQLELGSIPHVYSVTTSAASNIYVKTVAEAVKVLVTKYGNATTRFTLDDLDLSSLETFEFANPQQVGLYLRERTNVLEACNKLANSVGARLVMSRTGKLSLVKLHLPQATAGNAVTSTDILDRSLFVGSMVPVKAGCRIAYCKNWKVQENVALGVTEAHADLYEQEWLTVTQTDSTTATNYNLFTEPAQEETLLLVGADASTEAIRRLNVFNVQRKILKYKGFGSLMLETLGNPQTITHARFGLSGGVTGQIVGVTTDWLNQKVEIELLV